MKTSNFGGYRLQRVHKQSWLCINVFIIQSLLKKLNVFILLSIIVAKDLNF